MNVPTSPTCAPSTGTTPTEGKENEINFSKQQTAETRSNSSFASEVVRPAIVSPGPIAITNTKKRVIDDAAVALKNEYFIQPRPFKRSRMLKDEEVEGVLFEWGGSDDEEDASVHFTDDEIDDDLSTASFIVDEDSSIFKGLVHSMYGEEDPDEVRDHFFSKDYHDLGNDDASGQHTRSMPTLFDLAYQSSFRADTKSFLFECTINTIEWESDRRYDALKLLRGDVIDRLSNHPEEAKWRHPKTGKYFIHYLMSDAFMGLSSSDIFSEYYNGETIAYRYEKQQKLVEIAKLAIEACPDALGVADNDGIFPIHYACKWLSREPEIMKMILEASPQSAFVRDKYGDLPLHRLFNLVESMHNNMIYSTHMETGFVQSLQILIEYNPQALLAQDGLGHDPWSLFCHLWRRNKSDGKNELAVWILRKRADVARNPLLMFHDAERFIAVLRSSDCEIIAAENLVYSEAYAHLRDNAHVLDFVLKNFARHAK